jgi:hypothetical protein
VNIVNKKSSGLVNVTAKNGHFDVISDLIKIGTGVKI